MKAIFALVMSGIASAAFAQSAQISAAISAGQVGERYDGYMGFAATPSDALRREVLAINIQRRNLYTQLAVQRNVNVQVVGITTGCVMLRQLSVGEAYMLEDKVWRRHSAGQPAPAPEACR